MPNRLSSARHESSVYATIWRTAKNCSPPCPLRPSPPPFPSICSALASGNVSVNNQSLECDRPTLRPAQLKVLQLLAQFAHVIPFILIAPRRNVKQYPAFTNILYHPLEWLTSLLLPNDLRQASCRVRSIYSGHRAMVRQDRRVCETHLSGDDSAASDPSASPATDVGAFHAPYVIIRHPPLVCVSPVFSSSLAFLTQLTRLIRPITIVATAA
jgi:hypothetical protein